VISSDSEDAMKKLTLFILLFIASGQPLMAADPEMAKVETALKGLMPKASPDAIAESAISGLYEAVYGAQVVYVSSNGQFMIEGDIYDLKKRVNLTETKRQGGRLKAMNSIDDKSMIVFKPEKGKAKHVITAFTDIDCGYCRKLHDQVKAYNKLGIELRYLAFPRAGIDSPSYHKAVAVWCATDRNKAMNFAKGGANLSQLQQVAQVEDKACKDPIKNHYEMARQVGVTGTPTLVMEDGSVLPGYVPPERLIKILDSSAKKI